LADAADTWRADYITEQIRATKRALEAGIDVRGHMYWSLMDNYEWALGIHKRFGLIHVNYDTLERTIRPSAWVYKDIIENGLPDSGDSAQN
jgi:beta-glucosidase